MSEKPPKQQQVRAEHLYLSLVLCGVLSRGDVVQHGGVGGAAGVRCKVGVLRPAGGGVPIWGGDRGPEGPRCTGLLAVWAVTLHLCLGRACQPPACQPQLHAILSVFCMGPYNSHLAA